MIPRLSIEKAGECVDDHITKAQKPSSSPKYVHGWSDGCVAAYGHDIVKSQELCMYKIYTVHQKWNCRTSTTEAGLPLHTEVTWKSNLKTQGSWPGGHLTEIKVFSTSKQRPWKCKTDLMDPFPPLYIYIYIKVPLDFALGAPAQVAQRRPPPRTKTKPVTSVGASIWTEGSFSRDLYACEPTPAAWF